MNNSQATAASNSKIDPVKSTAPAKVESSFQGRTISEVPENTSPDWLKKALLVAIVVASIFVLAFALAVTAGLSGVALFSGLAKSATAILTTNGTYALLGFSYLGGVMGLAYSILGLSKISDSNSEKPISKDEKELKEFRKKMGNSEFGAFETLVAEKKTTPMAMQAFFEFCNSTEIQKYLGVIGGYTRYHYNPPKLDNPRNEREPKLLNSFSKSSPNPDERAAWAFLNLTIRENAGPWPTGDLSEQEQVLEQAAKEGTALANFLLAQRLGDWCYFEATSIIINGKARVSKYSLEHINNNLDKAIKHCEYAANKGLPAAIFWLAVLKMQKLTQSKEQNEELNNKPKTLPKEILDHIQLAADKGLRQAQFLLGQLYDKRENVEKNFVLGLRGYHSFLGLRGHHKGYEIEKNPVLSKSYYQLAADQGCANAMCGLACQTQDVTVRENLVKKAAALGRNDAKMYFEDQERIKDLEIYKRMTSKKDVFEFILSEARPLNPFATQLFFERTTFERARSYTDALLNQGKEPLFSKTSPNPSERAAWARLVLEKYNENTFREAFGILIKAAVEEGDALANCLLGQYYLTRPTSSLDKTPEEYLEVAAAKHLPLAKLLLAQLEKTKKDKDLNKIEWLLADAANGGIPEAQFELACHFEETSNLDGAKVWLESAAESNYPRALHTLANKYREGKFPFEKNEEKAKDYEKRATALIHYP